MLKIRIAVIGALTMFVQGTAFAHSGKTDASGCHTEKKTVEYHCHHESTPLVKNAKTTAKTDAKTDSGMIMCIADIYNCPDFGSHAEAQSVFEECLGDIGYDVHRLDADDDYAACESL